MVVYDLSCGQAHRFEGWFSSADDYVKQLACGQLACPLCESKDVHKVPSAPHLQARSGGKAPVEAISNGVEVRAKLAASVLEQIRDVVLKNSEDVGSQFASEARKIHYGEAKERGIRGQATQDEVRELRDEGVDVLSLPNAALDKSKLN